MSAAGNAKSAAIEALIEAHAVELKLPTVKRRFRAMAEEATREQQSAVAYLGAPLEAEVAERSERRERGRLIEARFPVMKSLEEFNFAENPNIPQTTIAALAEGSWISDRESVIFSAKAAPARRTVRVRSNGAAAKRTECPRGGIPSGTPTRLGRQWRQA